MSSHKSSFYLSALIQIPSQGIHERISCMYLDFCTYCYLFWFSYIFYTSHHFFYKVASVKGACDPNYHKFLAGVTWRSIICIALVGHSVTHSPHPTHFLISIKVFPWSTLKEIAPNMHRVKQVLHPEHNFWLTFATYSPFSIEFFKPDSNLPLYATQ